MKALITGASSGIGRDMAKYLSKLGYDLVIVARNREALEELKKELKTNIEIISMDLSQNENCYKLHEQVKDIDILINNAGFGEFGNFVDTNLEKEISMIETNITALHILTKLFLYKMIFGIIRILTKLYLKDMVEKDRGHIMNVASIAGFMPGPLMATYYASKNYVVSLTRAIEKELKKKKSKVSLSLLCPGPVNTNFNNVANVKFKAKGLSSEYVAKYAVDKMLKNKFIIIPGLGIKCTKFFSKIMPTSLIEEFCYYIQVSKNK